MVAENHCTVLITGPSGSGKELIARTIRRLSPRSNKPFVSTNCGALPESLLESQLFGHEKGAFTGATRSTLGIFRASNRGTVFLDEITEMSPALQVKLLRVLQEREVTPVGGTRPHAVDIRLIAASNRPMEELLDDKILRRDLYYRLSVVHIEIPRLQDRREDIPLLATHFVHRHALEYGRPPVQLTAEASRLLMQYDWPGNVRELSNAIERLYALRLGPRISAADLSLQLRHTPSRRREEPANTYLPSWEESEKQLIVRALSAANGQKTVAARLLKIDRHRLARKIKKYQLDK
jgi:transcriptional regulator with PAS, ATPase and Fis domain